MAEVSLFISVGSFVIALVSLGLSIKSFLRSGGVERAQIRNDLLNKLVQIQIAYSQIVYRLDKGVPEVLKALPYFQERLNEMTKDFQRLEKKTGTYIEKIENLKDRPSAQQLVDVRIPIDALLLQMEHGNKRADELVEGLKKDFDDFLIRHGNKPAHELVEDLKKEFDEFVNRGGLGEPL